MKQYTTLENEILMNVDKNSRNMENYRFSCLLREPGRKEGKHAKNRLASGPGTQVINNIMNYARSLEVLRQPSGKPIFLIGN